MEPNHPIHRRRSIRLPEYDYTQPGAYFVTICVHEHEWLFGHIQDSEMVLNDCGKIVREEWFKSSQIRHEIEMDQFVVMPNHIHGIVIITETAGGRDARRAPGGDHNCRGARPCAQDASGMKPAGVGATGRSPLHRSSPPHKPTGPPPKSLGAFVAGFKSAATKRINQLRNTPGAPVWQRNYYEHIIRDEGALHRIREYILYNPRRWQFDRDNPEGQTDSAENEFWQQFGIEST